MSDPSQTTGPSQSAETTVAIPARRRGWPAEIALTATAIMGVMCLLALTAALIFDLRPVVFRSNSMAPAIPVRSLALVQTRAASDLALGDVVSVPSATGARITHRIIGIEPATQGVSLQLKGDNNAEADPQPYVVDKADRVVWSAPGLGAAIAITQSTPFVFFAGICLGAAGLAIWRPRPPRPNRPRRPGRRGKAAAGALVIVVALAGAQTVRPVSASFTDSGAFAAEFIQKAVGSGTLLLARSNGLTYATDSVQGAFRADGEAGWHSAPVPPLDGPTLFLAAASNQVMAMSATHSVLLDLTTWQWGTPRPIPAAPNALGGGVMSDPDTRWTMFADGRWWRSDDAGASWTVFAPTGVTVPFRPRFLAFSNGGYVAAAGDGVLSAPNTMTLTFSSQAANWGNNLVQHSVFGPTSAFGLSNKFALIYSNDRWWRSNSYGATWTKALSLDAVPEPIALTGGGNQLFVTCTEDQRCFEIFEDEAWLGPNTVTEIGWPWS